MSESEKLTVDRILELWKANCGEVKTSGVGTTYLVIPIADRRGHFLNLIQAMVIEGYVENDIRSASVSTKVVKTCWSDLIVKMTAKDLKRNRDIARRQWEEAIDEFFVTDFPKYSKPEKANTTQKQENVTELNPKNRIQMDTSDMAEAPLDEEILAELAAIGTILEEKK